MKSKALNDPQTDLIPSRHMEIKNDGQAEPNSADYQDDEFFIRASLLKNPEHGVELLYSRYYQALCTHAIKFVGSREIAEDIVSDIFFQFYSKKIFTRITISYRAYLFRTVRNRGYNYIRWEGSKKIPMEENFDIIGNESQQPDHITQYEELYQDLEKAVNTLPLQRRNIYLQFHFEEKPLKQIALELGISVRTVEVQVYRARQAIRALIKNKWFISVLMILTIS